MNNEYIPLFLRAPEVQDRKKDRPRPIPVSQERLAQRSEIAYILGQQVETLSQSLSHMTDDERRAVFYKLEHEGTLPLEGTNLKPVTETSGRVTLALPRENTLDPLVQKIRNFGIGEAHKGHIPSEQLGTRLISIEQGKPTDRLSVTMLEQYDSLVKEEWVICEIEIMAVFERSDRQKQNAIRKTLSDLEKAFQSRTRGNIFEHDIDKEMCRAIIRCTGELFKELVEGPEWITRIWWFEERPEFETLHSIVDNFTIGNLGPITGPADNAPVVCLVDSGVTIGNPFLRPIIRQDMIKSFLAHNSHDPFDAAGHGSAVASLVSYYALNIANEAENNGQIWIASARILDENSECNERLLSNVLTEVVKEFAPMGVRIFNLSVVITNRPWNVDLKRMIPRQSWVARAIDKLSREYDVVFVTATGNIYPPRVRQYYEEGQPYPQYFCDDDACIQDPSQASLALTIGAIAQGSLVVGPLGESAAIAQVNQPAPFTRCGPGMSREIKPELVEFGGNLLFNEAGGQIHENMGTNVLVASNKTTPAITHTWGTSLSAPRVANRLALILHDLSQICNGTVSAPLLKAFTVNSATYKGDTSLDTIKCSLDEHKRKHWLNVLGYGSPDAIRATDCHDESYVAYYQGEINSNKVAYFDIPAPPCLADTGNAKKRLTITVAYYPEVQRLGLGRYLGTTLRWRLFRDDINRDDILTSLSGEADTDEDTSVATRDLTGAIGINIRSRGTVQHDVFEWTQHTHDPHGHGYTLAVAAYERWGRATSTPVPYAVVVRLEVESAEAPVYSQAKSILAGVEVETRVRVRAVQGDLGFD